MESILESDTKEEAEYIYSELIKSSSLLDYDIKIFCENVVNKLNELINRE